VRGECDFYAFTRKDEYAVTTLGAIGLDPADVAAHYDDLDRFYRRFWGEHVHHGLWTTGRETPEEATRRLVSFVAELAGARNGSEVCDAGCGYGASDRMLVAEYGARVTGLTISEAQHTYATSLDPSARNPTYLLRDWLKNDLPAESFDAVIAIESTEHMPDLAAFFREASRVLRPRGRLVVCAWLTRDYPGKCESRWLIGPICREGRLRGMETAAEYARLGQLAGLRPEAFQDLSRQVKKTWPICARRVVQAFLREPASRRYLLRTGGPNRVFALTIFRIWLAYEIGAMRYGLFTYSRNAE
jgi:tocopherol O-methyltransferase